jgi:hypothetical protein
MVAVSCLTVVLDSTGLVPEGNIAALKRFELHISDVYPVSSMFGENEALTPRVRCLETSLASDWTLA